MQKVKTRYEQIPLQSVKKILEEELQHEAAIVGIRSTKNTKQTVAILATRAVARGGSRS